MGDQGEGFVDVEPARGRHHIIGAFGDKGDAVNAGAMAERRGMNHAGVGRHLVDIGVIIHGAGHQAAVGDHRALGLAGGAGGIK